ncbi:MAG: tripartite tricarboxylate transporter TctB family protein, partial [Betaproteobacteria bacterium]
MLGFVLLIRSLRLEGPPVPRLVLRPAVFLICASVAFGYLVRPLGFLIATLLLVIASAAGGRQFRWREVIPLAMVLAVFAFCVFVYGLGLPFPIWPEAFG